MDSLWGDMRPMAPQQLKTVGHGGNDRRWGPSTKSLAYARHAVHHIVWQLEDIAFTGDVGGVKIANHLVVPPCPPPDINVEDWQQSIRLLRSLGRYVFNPLRAGFCRTGAPEPIGGTIARLGPLDVALYEKQIPQEEITPLFQTFVANRFKEKGIDSLGIEQYEAANPSWMSVTGLLRYWSKKLEPTA